MATPKPTFEASISDQLANLRKAIEIESTMSTNPSRGSPDTSVGDSVLGKLAGLSAPAPSTPQPGVRAPLRPAPVAAETSRRGSEIAAKSRPLTGILGGDVRLEEAVARVTRAEKSQPVNGLKRSWQDLNDPQIEPNLVAAQRAQHHFAPATSTPVGEGPLLSSAVSDAAANAFHRLGDAPKPDTGDTSRSTEEIARDLLKPMLKSWLDHNLGDLVERLVREEIQRVARAGRG